MNKKDILYTKIIGNYNSCFVNETTLSDTWRHTLVEKGKTFSMKDLDDLLLVVLKIVFPHWGLMAGRLHHRSLNHVFLVMFQLRLCSKVDQLDYED